MKLAPRIVWQVGDDPLDPRVVPLVAAIAATGSVAAAAARAGLSYRAAWGLLRDYERELGAPLATLARGRGATLAPAGEALMQADASVAQRLGPSLAQFAFEVGPAMRAQLPLRIAASHDIALAQLRDALPASSALRLDLSFMGSLDALAAFARGDVDLAGFHVPSEGMNATTRAKLDRWLKPRRDRLVWFAEREQGLIVPPGNPRRVRTLADVAAKKLRFVNRERGSGTRLLVDSLLARAGVAPARVAGYNSSERNHVAVAAAVAAGTADVGFGLRAAAAEFGLGFVPAAKERYLFAVRADALDAPRMHAFLDLLRGPLPRRAMRGLPGYDASAAGSVIETPALHG
jgi:molybdate transport repressor ModE-like protein